MTVPKTPDPATTVRLPTVDWLNATDGHGDRRSRSIRWRSELPHQPLQVATRWVDPLGAEYLGETFPIGRPTGPTRRLRHHLRPQALGGRKQFSPAIVHPTTAPA